MLTSNRVVVPEKIEKAMFGFMVSHILFTTQKLGIFDALSKRGPHTSKSLASQCCVPEESLSRLLYATVSAGFLTYDEGEFSLEKSLEPFFQSGGLSHFKNRFAHYENATVKLFQYLEEGIKTNRSQWEKIDPNFSQENLFASIYMDDEATRLFLENMWALGFDDSLELCEHYSLSEYSRLIDLGGATGSFTVPALMKNLGLTAVVLDNQKVEKHFAKKRDEYELSNRMFFQPGDFFEDELPDGDLFSLGYILSDWKDEQCRYLLKKIYHKLPKDGALLVLEKVFDDDMCGPFTTAMMDLNMLLETYGKHRNFAQYNALLCSVGYKDCQIVRSSGEKHMIIARK